MHFQQGDEVCERCRGRGTRGMIDGMRVSAAATSSLPTTPGSSDESSVINGARVLGTRRAPTALARHVVRRGRRS
jgi:hypothetical protein